MLDCLILGDSIAVGTHQFKPECQMVAKGGINSHQWNTKYSKNLVPAKTVIISLGSNDHDGVNSFRELLAMRRNVSAEKVFWIMPAIKPHVRGMVEIIANNYGDTVLPIKYLQKDGVHPSWRGYKDIAEGIKNVTN